LNELIRFFSKIKSNNYMKIIFFLYILFIEFFGLMEISNLPTQYKMNKLIDMNLLYLN